MKNYNIHIIADDNFGKSSNADLYEMVSNKFKKHNYTFTNKEDGSILSKTIRNADFIIVFSIMNYNKFEDVAFNPLLKHVAYAKSVCIENSSVIQNKNPKIILVVENTNESCKSMITLWLFDKVFSTSKEAFKYIEQQIEEIEKNETTTS